jgi:hypothetical protein
MTDRDRVPIMLAINISVSRLDFFEISGIVINSANKKFTLK